VGANAHVGDAKSTVGDLGLTLIGKNTEIPPDFRIGRNVVIAPDFSEAKLLKRFPDRVIPAGTAIE